MLLRMICAAQPVTVNLRAFPGAVKMLVWQNLLRNQALSNHYRNTVEHER